jgi:hypothetical protein
MVTCAPLLIAHTLPALSRIDEPEPAIETVPLGEGVETATGVGVGGFGVAVGAGVGLRVETGVVVGVGVPQAPITIVTLLGPHA